MKSGKGQYFVLAMLILSIFLITLLSIFYRSSVVQVQTFRASTETSDYIVENFMREFKKMSESLLSLIHI